MWIAEERPEAEARLKVALVLDEFAKRNQIEPADEEVDRFIAEQASKDDELKGRVDELKRGPNSRRYFASRLRRLRVLERLGGVAGTGTPAQSCPNGTDSCLEGDDMYQRERHTGSRV